MNSQLNRDFYAKNNASFKKVLTNSLPTLIKINWQNYNSYLKYFE